MVVHIDLFRGVSHTLAGLWHGEIYSSICLYPNRNERLSWEGMFIDHFMPFDRASHTRGRLKIRASPLLSLIYGPSDARKDQSVVQEVS